MGYSDTTVSLFAVLKAGVVPFYGPAVLSAFAENGGIFPYLKYGLEKVCFQAEPAGLLKPNEAGWSNERLEWDNESLLSQKRQLKPSSGWRWLQGEGLARGHLMGGCVEVLEFIKATPVWPDADTWKGCLLFLETSEEKMAPMTLRRNLRNYGAQGILANCAGLMLGRPYDDVHWKEYDEVLLQVVRDELGLEIPIVSGMDFGHSEPMLTVPIGVSAELDCAAREFRIVEAAVSQA
jgi:muramoyltetrapeptide carboxypeptidase LdcA involved in peptidoglycan recycling